MALEFPTDLINRLKKATRAEAGLSDDVFTSFDNNLPPLPSLSGLVAAFDPSPPYLRCKNCHGRLLRGVESLFCIYCGRPTDFVHPPLSFKDTIACRWLLESLHLDGSDMVGPPVKRSELNGGPSVSEEIPLSDLLDLKIQWPTVVEKKEYGSSNKEPDKRSSINFTGVDLDNFFSTSKLPDLSSTPEESSLIRNKEEATDYQVDATNYGVNLFENVQPSEPTITTSDEKSSKSFSGWEADFQTAGAIDQVSDNKSLDQSGYQPELSKLSDPVSRATQDLSSGLNSAFRASEYFKDEKGNTDSAAALSSGDWMSEDVWDNLSSTIPQQTVQSNENIPANNSAPQDKLSNLSSGLDWFEVDPFPVNDPYGPTSSRTDNDDDWNDFTSSTGVQASSQNIATGIHNQSIAFSDEMAKSNIFSSDRDFEETDLSSFSLAEPVVTSVAKEMFQKLNSSRSEASFVDRAVESGSEAAEGAGQPTAEGDAKSPSNERKQDVEMLISEMHDLSFMLETKLSLPLKSDGPGLLP